MLTADELLDERYRLMRLEMAAGSRPEDTALVAAAKNGDLSAFEKLVRVYTGAVYAHAMRFFGNQQTAEDVVQEVFIKVFRSIAGFDGNSAFSTWLYRVTRNVCVDTLRTSRRHPAPIDLVDITLAASDDPASEAITTATVEQAMRALPPEDRDALSAIGLFGMTYAEAAETLGVPEGTIKSRVFRARRLLVTALVPKGSGR